MSRVLIVATSRKTRGGITSVVKAHEAGEQWEKFHCRWIETHVDKGAIAKILVFIRGLIVFFWYLPSADIVHIHLSEVTSARRKKVFFDLAKLFRKKVIIHFHSFSPDTTICGSSSKLYRYLFCNADVVIVLSDYWKKMVNMMFDLGDRVKVIFNPCPKVVRYQTNKTNSILYAGTLIQRKGYPDLIRAFARIASNYPEWKLEFAGNGEIEHARDLAHSLGIEKQVRFLGWVSGDLKNKVYSEASVFCLPSYAEGFPMAVLDAWAFGLPVIATPVGGIPDIAENGKNILLFNPGDIVGLSECLVSIIVNKELRSSMERESMMLASTTFNVRTINRQIGDLYYSLLNDS